MTKGIKEVRILLSGLSTSEALQISAWLPLPSGLAEVSCTDLQT